MTGICNEAVAAKRLAGTPRGPWTAYWRKI